MHDTASPSCMSLCASVCELTERPSHPKSSQRVEGTHDGSHGSDPHWDGMVVGVVWASGEAPRLHQQQVFHSVHGNDSMRFIRNHFYFQHSQHNQCGTCGGT